MVFWALVNNLSPKMYNLLDIMISHSPRSYAVSPTSSFLGGIHSFISFNYLFFTVHLLFSISHRESKQWVTSVFGWELLPRRIRLSEWQITKWN